MQKLFSWISAAAVFGVMLAGGCAEDASMPTADASAMSPARVPANTTANSEAEESEVFFSPRGSVTAEIAEEINAARREICVQAYGFTSKPIVDALLAARARGVQVSVILDKSNEQARYTAARRLADAGVPVMIDYKPAIAHNKIILIDGALIITGSFNFTESAEKRNAENCVFLRNAPALFAKYREYFESRRQESRVFDAKRRE